jgi:hypothetical protein
MKMNEILNEIVMHVLIEEYYNELHPVQREQKDLEEKKKITNKILSLEKIYDRYFFLILFHRSILKLVHWYL